MATLKTFTKDPNAVLDYQLNWSAWLDTGDTLSNATFTPETGITVVSTQFTDTTATVRLSGGTSGVKYNIVNHVTTADGLQDDRTITISVKER